MKFLLEHLHKVHLALVATCLALVVATLITPTAKADKAKNDVDVLRRMSSRLGDNWMDVAAREVFATLGATAGGLTDGYINVAKTFDSSTGLSIPFKIPPDEWAVLPPKWNTTTARSDPNEIFQSGLGPNRVRVPGDIRAWTLVWDELADVSRLLLRPRVPSHGAHCLAELRVPRLYRGPSIILSLDELNPNHPIVPCEISQIKRYRDGMNGETVRARLAEVVFEPFRVADSSDAQIGPADLQLRFFETISGEVLRAWADYDAESVHFVPQEWLARRFNGNWPTGKFAVSFPEVAELTKAFDDLPLEQAFRIVAAEAERSRPGVPIFGVEIPARALTSVGAIVLLSLQLYLGLQLGQVLALGTSLRSVDFVPWFPLYGTLEAKATSVVTMSVLPVVVAFRFLWIEWSSPLLWVAVPASLALSARTSWLLNRMWRNAFDLVPSAAQTNV